MIQEVFEHPGINHEKILGVGVSMHGLLIQFKELLYILPILTGEMFQLKKDLKRNSLYLSLLITIVTH